MREGGWILRGLDGEILDLGPTLGRWLSRRGWTAQLRVCIDRAIEALDTDPAEAGDTSLPSRLRVSLPCGTSALLLDRLPIPGTGELLLVRRFLGPSMEGAPASSFADELAEEALRLEHLIRGHLATRLIAPLAHLAGPSVLAGADPALSAEGAYQERLVRHLVRAMENVLVLASEVLPEARRSGRSSGWVELSRLLNLLAGTFLGPIGARVNQRVEVRVDGPVWLRVPRPPFRLMLEMCLDIVLSSGLDARMEIVWEGPWPTLRLRTIPPTGSITRGPGDLSLVPAARALATSLGLPIEFNLDNSGQAEMKQVLFGCSKGRAPSVGLCCMDEDLSELLSALLESVGVRVVDLNTLAEIAEGAPLPTGLDVVLVDLDSHEGTSTPLHAELRRRLPEARMLALTSEPVVDDAWHAIATKPVSLSRLVELLEFVGE